MSIQAVHVICREQRFRRRRTNEANGVVDGPQNDGVPCAGSTSASYITCSASATVAGICAPCSSKNGRSALCAAVVVLITLASGSSIRLRPAGTAWLVTAP